MWVFIPSYTPIRLKLNSLISFSWILDIERKLATSRRTRTTCPVNYRTLYLLVSAKVLRRRGIGWNNPLQKTSSIRRESSGPNVMIDEMVETDQRYFRNDVKAMFYNVVVFVGTQERGNGCKMGSLPTQEVIKLI